MAILCWVLVAPAGVAFAASGDEHGAARHAAHRKCRKTKKRKKCRAKHPAHSARPTGLSDPVVPPLPGASSSLGASPPQEAPAEEPGTPEPELEPPPKLDKIASGQIAQLPTAQDPTLVVTGEHSFAPGQFLAAAPGPTAPEGFLLKVVSSGTEGGDTEVVTTPGSLYEAVPNGTIDVDLGDLGSATPANADARKISAAIRDSPSATSDKVPFKKNVRCNGSAVMTLDGDLTTSLAPHLKLQWHKRFGIPTGIDKARATLDASVSAEAQSSVTGQASCALGPITLADPSWVVIVEVGPVPVPITIRVPITLKGSAEVGGSVNVRASAHAQGSFGVAYENGGIKGIHELSKSASLGHSANAQARLEARLGVDVSVTAGWKIPVIGKVGATIDVGISSGPKLTYQAYETPPGRLCVTLYSGGSVELDLPGDRISTGPITLYDGNIRCVQWGGGPKEVEEAENGEREEVEGNGSEDELEKELRELEEEIERGEFEEEEHPEIIVQPPYVPVWFGNQLDLVEQLRTERPGGSAHNCDWTQKGLRLWEADCFGVLWRSGDGVGSYVNSLSCRGLYFEGGSGDYYELYYTFGCWLVQGLDTGEPPPEAPFEEFQHGVLCGRAEQGARHEGIPLEVVFDGGWYSTEDNRFRWDCSTLPA